MKTFIFIVLILSLALPCLGQDGCGRWVKVIGEALNTDAYEIDVRAIISASSCSIYFLDETVCIDSFVFFIGTHVVHLGEPDTACWEWSEPRWILEETVIPESVGDYVWRDGALRYDSTWVLKRFKVYKPCEPEP